FTGLFEKYFKQVKILGQRIYCNSNIWPIFSRGNPELVEYVIERNPREFAFVESDKKIPLYFIAVASDAGVNENSSNLVDISNELLNQKDRVYAAARDNLGNTIKSQQQALSEKDQQLAQLATDQTTFQGYQQSLVEKEQQLAQLAAEGERFLQEAGRLQ